MTMQKGLLKKFIVCVLTALALAVVFTACELKDPVTESTYYIIDNQSNYYNKDHTTNTEAVDEFTDSITALRTYLQSADFVDSGYYMGVNFDIDLRNSVEETVGNFALRVQAYMYTFPYEDDFGNPLYYYYENGKYIEATEGQAADGSRKLISGLEIHNEAIKKSDISIEWYDGARNTVLIGMYFDGLNSNAEDPGNILYLNVQGYKRSFPEFGDTVLYQQLVRLLVSLSVEGLLEAVGLQGDAGAGEINKTMVGVIGENYKRVVNGDDISLYFYQVALDALGKNVSNLLYRLLGVFGRKWDPMTNKFLGFKFSTVANALVTKIQADMQGIISPDKSGATNVLTDAVFAFAGKVTSYDVSYDYVSNITFDYGWSYPENLVLDKLYYEPFVYGNYWFDGLLYVPAWDAQFDAVIKTDIQQYDNSKNNVFIEFRDIANGELMIGVYYRDERAWLDITGLSYMYGWVDLPALGFPQVYDEHIDLAEVLGKFFKIIDRVIVSIVDSILDPASSDKDSKALQYIMDKTSYTEKDENDIFSINSETLQVDIELVKQMLEETGQGTYSTRQIINILDSLMPYTMDQLAIMLGIVSAEVMLEKTYFTLTWDVDKQEFIIIMYTNVGVPAGEPSTMLFRLNLDPIYFGQKVTITEVDFSKFKPLREIYTYSGTLRGNFIFSSQETVDLSKLLSATIGESSGLNTPYQLATNAGLTFELIYDQFVKDQYADGRWKKAGRSSFTLSVWLTGSETSIIIQLSSDDVCFDNDVYKDLPAREDELGYIWVNIACVTKNGTQVIPKVKIREDVFMASMSAYMHNETAIEDDVSSFADNDFNLSLTSIITALCKDAYVIPASKQLEITSSNETLQNLFRVKGLIGNIKVDAGFDYRVSGLESIRKEYYMYNVGYFDDITGNSPYDTALHKTLEVFFYEDYMDEYDPLKYDFLVYADNVILDDGTLIASGTTYIFQLGARRTITMQPIDYASGSPFASEKNVSPDNNDISRMKFSYEDLILDPKYPASRENMLVYESEGRYYYRNYAGKQKQVDPDYVETGVDGTVYIYWQGIREVVFFESESSFYFYDLNRAVLDEDGNQAYLAKKTERNLLFEYDPESVRVTEICLPQYAPRTNGSFMGEVRRYFVTFETQDKGELGKVSELYFAYDRENDYYYDENTGYPRYFSEADKNYIYREYDDDGKLTFEEARPISLYVMEPCEPLAETVRVNVLTTSATQVKEFSAKFVIDWERASGDKKGYIVEGEEGTQVIIAPGMMGEVAYPVRIIVTNREIATNEYVVVYEGETTASRAPVIDEIEVDPYEYVLQKYAFLSNTNNFNPAYQYNETAMLEAYNVALNEFTAKYFSQEKYAFTINFNWQQSYLFDKAGTADYIAKVYENLVGGVLTRYVWKFDESSTGSNRESSIAPDGGTIYLHGYFKGQLVALKVKIGKREFSHVKFYENDSFDPDAYNADNESGKPYVNGAYRGNYYDETTYVIDKAPIFVFTDGSNEYEYVFDMRYISGIEGGNAKYVDSYEIKWGNTSVTNVTSIGSYNGEYAYSYLYKGDETAETGVLYDLLTDAQRARKVKVLRADKSIGEEFLYAKESGSGAAKMLVRWKYEDLATVLTESELNGTVFATEYGDGAAEKFIKDRTGYAMVRETDVEGELVLTNRPFYYYYFILTESNLSEYLTASELELYNYTGNDREKAEQRAALREKYKLGLNVRYLTEGEYSLYYYNGDDDGILAQKAALRTKYGFNSDDTETITTAGLDLYYLLRLYFVLNNETYALSTLSNEIIQPDKITDQAIGATGFGVIELRIEVDCPQLEVDQIEGVEKDQLTGENFTKDKVDAGAKALGYYLVDPLNASTLVLPDSLVIYFKNEGFESSHEFSGLTWAASFDENNQPVYTYTDLNGATKTLIAQNAQGRYVLQLDLDEIDEELLFKAMIMIGNDVSGYRKVTVAIRVLSKDPTNVDFYTTRTGEKLLTTKTTAEYVSGEGSDETTTKITYYTYYVNTFANFNIPDRLVATFTDGHTQEYRVTWTAVYGDLAFAPNTVVTLQTTIGTDGGVTVDIYLAVVVDNLELNRMEINSEIADYYVTVQNANGEILDKKIRIADLFRLEGRNVGYYYREGARYFVRISTGSREDGDTEETKIGLYSYSQETGRYIWRQALGIYDFIQAVYSKATLTLDKAEVTMNEQKIINNAKPISEYWIQLRNGMSTQRVQISNVVTLTYSYRPTDNDPNLMTVRVGFTFDNKLYVPDLDDDGLMTIGDSADGSTRKISYAEFVSIVVREEMSQQYDSWRVIAVDGRYEDTEGTPFGTNRTIPYFVRFMSATKTLELKNSSGVDLLGLAPGGEITLRKPNNEEVTMSYYEFVYRLTNYYSYQRVAAGAQVTVSNKDISIKDLKKIMDVNDMLIRLGSGMEGDSGDKYVISLGTGKGAYDLTANMRFTGGYILADDYTGTETVNVNVYGDNGDPIYANGYVFSGAISASVVAIVNDGSGATKAISYNRLPTDAKLPEWHVEATPRNVNVTYDDLITRIAATDIYSTGKERQITVSALTSEGFRIKRTVSFELLQASMTTGYSGGNAQVPFETSKTFAISNGTIEIENVYDFVAKTEGAPSVDDYFGTPNYLPTTVSVRVNGRTITVSNVKWNLTRGWLNTLAGLTYKGTSGSVMMATADILGCPENAGSQVSDYFGTTRLSAYIVIESAEVEILPWETSDLGNGLSTETLLNDDGNKTYVVYVDAYGDADALQRGAIAVSETGRRYLNLGNTLLAQYTGGKEFTFSGIRYVYGGTREVNKVYFDNNGIDVTTMISPSGDLTGISATLLNERYLDLTVSLGLGQTLSVRVYFHNKNVNEREYLVYYDDYYNEDGQRLLYSTLTEEAKAATLGTTSELAFKEGADGYVLKANYLYYYVDYYQNGDRPTYLSLTSAQKAEKIEGTDVDMYIQDGVYARKAALAYNDMLAVIEADNEGIRQTIYDEKSSEFAAYIKEIVSGANIIRINYDLRGIVETAQSLRSAVRKEFDVVNISTSQIAETTTAIRAKLREAVENGVGGYYDDAFDPANMAKTKAYTEKETHDYALYFMLKTSEELTASDESGIVFDIRDVIIGAGTNTNKARRITELVADYFDELMIEAYNGMIKNYIQTEYFKLLEEEANSLTKEQFNAAVYYKNMVEAGFDADKVVEKVYKLRDFSRSGLSASLAAKQLDLSLAIANGYGFTVGYEPYYFGGNTLAYSSLSAEEKALKVTYGQAEYDLYGQDTNGTTTVATPQYSYESILEGVIAQAIFEAFTFADGKMTTKDADYTVIREKVQKYFIGRLDLDRYRLGGTVFAGSVVNTYTIARFKTEIAYSTNEIVGKKTMRAFLANMISEAADFTSLGEDDWNDFKSIASNLITYSYNYITGYESTINSIRRNLTNGNVVEEVLRRLVETGVRTFVERIYAEAEYGLTIKNVQKLNGQIVPIDQYGASGYSLAAMSEKLNEHLAKYLIEPYYSFRSVPGRVLIFFEDSYMIGATTITDRTEDVSGRPYKTEINWTENGIVGSIDYLGGQGALTGVITSAVTGEAVAVHLGAFVENRSIRDEDKIVTTEYIEDAMTYLKSGSDSMGELTSDGKYLMSKNIYGDKQVFFFDFNASFGTDESRYGSLENAVRYVLTYAIDTTGDYTTAAFAGYDEKSVVVYEFKNTLDEDNEIVEQTLYVYNPFVFSQSKDLPSKIKVEGEMRDIKWNSVSIEPTGNITSGNEQQSISGKIVNKDGQPVSLKICVAQWSYTGFFRKTVATGGNTLKMTIEGEENRFISMDPLQFYFSAQSKYSPENYYVVSFSVRIRMDGEARRIVFGKTNAVDKYTGVIVSDDGFEFKAFYPENSRLLEYGTDDGTMEEVNRRSRYVLYWESLKRNQVIASELSQVKDCLVYLGNGDVGQFSLVALKEASGATVPTRATYGCERMSIDTIRFVNNKHGVETAEYVDVGGNPGTGVAVWCEETGARYILNGTNDSFFCEGCGMWQAPTDYGPNMLSLECSTDGCAYCGVHIVYNTATGEVTCKNEACVLFDEIEDALMAKSGQAAVVVSPDKYFPTTGEFVLRENNIHYDPSELTIRFLWNGGGYDQVLRRLRDFVAYAYQDVDEASRENYALNILMTWNKITEAERDEIVRLAMDYMRQVNAQLGDEYTEQDCINDAYALLAINEKYNYTGSVNRLRGGGNNNVVVTVLIGVADSQSVFVGSFIVKVLFADYTPFGYYAKEGTEYVNVTNSLSESAYLEKANDGEAFYNDLYITVRKDYYIMNSGVYRDAYEIDGRNMVTPYDEIGEDMMKLLQFFSIQNRTTGSGATRDAINGEGYLVHVTDIVWAYNEEMRTLTSEAFTIDGTTYASDLLTITLVP